MNILYTDLFSGDAREIFPYVDTGDFWSGEYILHAACRILYHNRATDESRFALSYAYRPEYVKDAVKIVVMSDWHDFDVLKKLGKAVPAAAVLKKYGVDCRAFINEEMKAGVICLLKDAPHRCLVGLLPQMTPWFFKENPMTETEKEFLMAALSDDSDRCNEIIREFTDALDIEAKIRTQKISSFVKNLLAAKMERVKREEADLISRIASLEKQIRDLSETYTSVCMEIAGIKATHNDSSAEEFARAFASNKNCHIDDIDKTRIVFVASGHLTNFSKSAYEAISRSMDSCLYKFCGRIVEKRKFKKMMDELVLGKRYRINLSGKITLDLGSNTFTLHRTNSNELVSNAMPNPHIAHYTCAGGFAAMYNEAFRNGDYMEVLDVVFSEVQNVNWTDYSPLQSFASDFCTKYWNRKIIWDKVDKKYIAPSELAAMITEEESKDEQG